MRRTKGQSACAPHHEASESGNVIFFILLAVVLIGMVTVAVRSGGDGANIDGETSSLRVSEIRQYADELSRGISFIMQQEVSESDIRFAHPGASTDYGDININPQFQMFHRNGGGADYKAPPADISAAPTWEFYGHTNMPGVGTSLPDLVAVMPSVTPAFCDIINQQNGYTQRPQDSTGDCVNAGAAQRFRTGATFTAAGSQNNADPATFSVQPALQGCVECNGGGLHFFQVLLAR